MCIMRGIIALLFLFIITASFASITYVTPGDGGKQFAMDTSSAKCQDSTTQAVYVCNGNVVKVVWKDSTKGSTFYVPDGRVINCPPGTPAQMGAVCLQYTVPNYCPSKSACGNSTPQIFPGQQNVTQQPNNTVVVTPPPAPTPQPTPVVQPTPTPVQSPPPPNNTMVQTNPTYPGNVDSGFNNLIIVLIIIAVVAVIVLFTMFRKSLHS